VNLHHPKASWPILQSGSAKQRVDTQWSWCFAFADFKWLKLWLYIKLYKYGLLIVKGWLSELSGSLSNEHWSGPFSVGRDPSSTAGQSEWCAQLQSK
jgi:hypothetical protein